MYSLFTAQLHNELHLLVQRAGQLSYRKAARDLASNRLCRPQKSPACLCLKK